MEIGRKTCFLSLEINGKFSDDILIKLYYDKAPITSNYFRSICIGQRGFGFENTFFNYLYIDGFIEGGETEIFTRDGNRFFDQVVFGEVTSGMHLLNAINQKGIRYVSRGSVVNLGEQLTATGAIQNDTLIGDVQPGSVDDTFIDSQVGDVGTDDNETQARDGTYHAEISIHDGLNNSQLRGVPMDKVIIYACGEKD
ncbi:unnamed protein product [Rotaria sp. Silwood2]|nr:unnamed protein product [Rotaria sp. Silwood2]